jgi:hypothetical protein
MEIPQLFDGPKRATKAGAYAVKSTEEAQDEEAEGGDGADERAVAAARGTGVGKGKKKKVQRGKKKGVETLMVVYYGRSTESIGAITVIDSATYADVRMLIRPLIEAYYRRLREVEGWENRHVDDGFSDKSDAFSIPDPQGIVVPKELEFVRYESCACFCLPFLTCHSYVLCRAGYSWPSTRGGRVSRYGPALGWSSRRHREPKPTTKTTEVPYHDIVVTI